MVWFFPIHFLVIIVQIMVYCCYAWNEFCVTAIYIAGLPIAFSNDEYHIARNLKKRFQEW